MGQILNLVSPITGGTNKGADYTVINTNDKDVADDYKASYVQGTLAGELQRIKAYIAEIGREAAFLELKAKGASVSETSTLAEIAEAMLSIVKNSAADASDAATFQKDSSKQELILDAGNQTVLPSGYYLEPVTVKTTTLSDLSQGTAVPLDILKDKTAWVNGTKVTGILDTDLSGKSAGNSAYKEDNDKLVIYLNEDSVNSENNRTVNTGIKYVTANEIQDKVTIKKVLKAEGEGNNEENWAALAVEIPAGYYPSAISIPVRIESDDTEDKEEKVLNVTSVAVTGNINFDTAENIVLRPQATNFDYYTLVTVDKAKVSKDNTTGGYTVTSAGWVNTTDSFAGLSEGAYNTDAKDVTINNIAADGSNPAKGIVTITEKVHGYTPESIVVELPVVPNPLDQTNTTAPASSPPPDPADSSRPCGTST